MAPQNSFIWSLSSLLYLAGVHAVPAPHSHCRLLPSDSQWPAPSSWQALNASLHGRLLLSVPLASPCHDPTYDATACAALKEIWQVPQAYFGHPTQIMAPIFQNLSCSPFTPESSPCMLGNLAAYAINVTDAEDVITGLRFAQRNNLRISIKNTGHDYLGKSSGQGSLALWTHNLKSISFSNYSSARYSGPSIKMGAGVQAFEAYEAASEKGLRVVGGDCPTVGLVGGYSQGAGHGPLSTAYGLGADQVLEWEVVTAEGEHLIASPKHNADLYWALTGGGGGTYGVVLSMTAKAHRDGVVGGAGMAFFSAGLNETFWTLIERWQEGLATLADQRASVASLFTVDKFTLQVMTKLDASEADMLALLHPFTSLLDQYGVKYNLSTTSYPKYINHVNHYLGPLPYGIYDSSQMIGGRLIPRSVVETNNKGLLTAFRNIAEAGYEVDVLVQDVSHASVGNSPSDNAVLPAWRSSLMHVVVANYWNYAEIKTENLAVADEITNELMPQLYDITPGSGVYLNEADYQDPNWKTDFYGVNYDRLKAVKNKYDPRRQFYANKAVGSDDFEITSEGRLCRVA